MAAPGDEQNTRAFTFYLFAGLAAVLYVILLLAGSGAFVLAVSSLLPFLVTALIISGTVAWAAGGMLAQQAIFHRPPHLEPGKSAPPTFGAGARPAPRWSNDES